MNKSILKQLRWSMLGFGILMGLVFPAYAHLFVHWKEGLFIWFAVGAIGAGITVGLVNYVLVKRILLNRLMRIVDHAQNIKKGDFKTRLTLDSEDVIGDMVMGLNESNQAVSQILSRVVTHSQEVCGVSQNLSSSSQAIVSQVDSVEASARGIENSVTAISNEIQRVTSSANNVTDRIAEISHTSQHIAENLEGISSDIGKLSRNLQDSRKHAAESSAVTYEATEKSLNAVATMGKLLEATKEIGSIIHIIKRLSDQTNLLAINASIEAAAAGMEGKGFGVIADEIKELAERSTASADTIAGKLSWMQTSVNDIVTIVSEIRDIINSINTFVGSFNGSIIENSHQMEKLAEDIHFNSFETQKITVVISDVAKHSREVFESNRKTSHEIRAISHTMSEVQHAIEHTHGQSQSLETLTQSLNGKADELLSALQHFRY